VTCLDIPAITIDSYAAGLRTDGQGRNVPLSGSIEITSRCNLRCVHCYLARPRETTSDLGTEFTQDELFRIIDEIVEDGCLWLLITGGEPLFRPDFRSVYLHGKRKGLLITLFTNATLMTPRTADLLAEWPPLSVEITLYGMTEATYEAVTKAPGSYRRCMEGIELLLDKGVPFKLKSSILTLNCHEIPEMKEFAEEIGVEYRFDPVLIARLDGSGAPDAFRIPPEQVVALDLTDERRTKEIRSFAERFCVPRMDAGLLYQCGAGVNTFHIDAEGRLSPCLISRQPSYALRSGTFRRGWQEFIPSIRRKRRTKRTRCSGCLLAALCGRCPGLAGIERGDEEESIDYFCRIAHLRQEMVISGIEKGTVDNGIQCREQLGQEALCQAETDPCGTGR